MIFWKVRGFNNVILSFQSGFRDCVLSLLLKALVESASSTVTEKQECSEAKFIETVDLLTLHVLMLVPSKLGGPLFIF